MPRLRVIDRDGVELEIDAPAGTSLMEPLRDMDDGVTAICGGMCSCATCHVYIDEAWVPKLPAAMSDETDMLKDLTSYRPSYLAPVLPDPAGRRPRRAARRHRPGGIGASRRPAHAPGDLVTGDRRPRGRGARVPDGAAHERAAQGRLGRAAGEEPAGAGRRHVPPLRRGFLLRPAGRAGLRTGQRAAARARIRRGLPAHACRPERSLHAACQQGDPGFRDRDAGADARVPGNRGCKTRDATTAGLPPA